MERWVKDEKDKTKSLKCKYINTLPYTSIGYINSTGLILYNTSRTHQHVFNRS